MRQWNRCAAHVVLVCVLASHVQTTPAETGQGGADTGPLAAGPVEGGSLGEWTARWWRWALGQWVAPYLDPDGRLCDVGQDGPVWFLAGTDGTFKPRRVCVVPEGKHLLVPVINMVHWQPRDSDAPCTELQARAAVNNNKLASAVVLLDGEPLGDIRLRRVRSDGCFRMDPDDPGSRLGAADGYWLMLKPLPRGRHTLVIGANYGDTGVGYGGMRQNFEYVLDVGGGVLLSRKRFFKGKDRQIASVSDAPEQK